MKRNIGATDKIIRILLAMAIMAVGFYNPHYWWMFIIGLVPLITGIAAVCPLYSILGISTCEKENCES